VNDYRSKVHVLPQDKLDSTVYETLQKNFEQKRNIFEQFVSDGSVSFTEVDKRFTPNKEVFNSDWSVQPGKGGNEGDIRAEAIEEEIGIGIADTVETEERVGVEENLDALNSQSNIESRINLDDKVLMYKDLSSTVESTSTQPTIIPLSSTTPSTNSAELETKKTFFHGKRPPNLQPRTPSKSIIEANPNNFVIKEKIFPNERFAEGGFRPILNSQTLKLPNNFPS